MNRRLQAEGTNLVGRVKARSKIGQNLQVIAVKSVYHLSQVRQAFVRILPVLRQCCAELLQINQAVVFVDLGGHVGLDCVVGEEAVLLFFRASEDPEDAHFVHVVGHPLGVVVLKGFVGGGVCHLELYEESCMRGMLCLSLKSFGQDELLIVRIESLTLITYRCCSLFLPSFLPLGLRRRGSTCSLN